MSQRCPLWHFHTKTCMWNRDPHDTWPAQKPVCLLVCMCRTGFFVAVMAPVMVPARAMLVLVSFLSVITGTMSQGKTSRVAFGWKIHLITDSHSSVTCTRRVRECFIVEDLSMSQSHVSLSDCGSILDRDIEHPKHDTSVASGIGVAYTCPQNLTEIQFTTILFGKNVLITKPLQITTSV